jgi:hypothetical protein
MIAYATGEPGAQIVDSILRNAANTCFAHAINLCEVYYDAYRNAGPEAAAQLIVDIGSSGVCGRTDMDTAFWQRAGRIKATQKRISLADCCGLALSELLDGEFVTADRHELAGIQQAGQFRVLLIR